MWHYCLGTALLGVLAGAALALHAPVMKRAAPNVCLSPGQPLEQIPGQVYVPPGEVWFNEDGPASAIRKSALPGFWMDRDEVTNAQFAAFVAATGYVTQAEREGHAAVFVPPGDINTLNPALWWRMVDGASWRHPTGAHDDIIGREHYPVVQVSYADALAYAHWAGRELPDELQWERAARGKQSGTRSPTSWAFAADGKPIANTWQGEFPNADTVRDGYAGLAPVGCFPANDFGLHDMIGNAWEWTRSVSDTRHRIIKGGSFLCAMNYCANFRPAGWQAQEADLPTSHIGFRTIAITATSKSKLIGG